MEQQKKTEKKKKQNKKGPPQRIFIYFCLRYRFSMAHTAKGQKIRAYKTVPQGSSGC